MTPGPPSAVSAARSSTAFRQASEKGRFQHEVFRRITGNEKLRQKQQIGALAGRIGARLTRFGKVSGDIADCRVQLGNGNLERIAKERFPVVMSSDLARCRPPLQLPAP